jgi:folate-binding protein YgfZ
LAVCQHTYDIPGLELLVPKNEREEVWHALAAAGVVSLEGDAAYTARRIELGRPAPGYELVQAYNPLEAGLAWVCADNKGCYTGQEIIARQLTYDKVTKTLVGLVAEDMLTAGAEVTHDGSVVGTVTSATFSPALGRPFALAIVKRSANAPGVELRVGAVPAHVIDSPYVRD